MKKTIYSRCSMLLASLMVAMVAFTACEEEDEAFVSLDAFGPTPLLRGETIRFIGSNLNRVTSVVFPESIEVAPTVVSSGEITAVIPTAAVNGFITLRYPGGSITTKSSITYADDVALDSAWGKADPVRAGDTITIAGDNLTGVTQVVFSVDVTVESRDFISQSRYEIRLTVPNNAQTGDLYLLAGASESRHLNLNVAGPAITAITATPLKPGRDTLHITGVNLDLAVSVIFPGDISTDVLPVSATEAKAAVPANALNGTVKVVSTTGLEYASVDAITLLAPSSVSHTATSYKAGNVVTISGNDLDLVTGVAFSGGVDAEFACDATNGITATIPAAATSGPITLRCVAGDVQTPDVTLAAPTITSVTPKTIQAGDEITIAGADLDLVTGITVGGKAGSIASQSATEIKATTPMDAAIAGTGVEVALTAANGASATDAIDVTFPAYCFILELPAADAEIKAGELLRVTVENSNMLTGVEANGAATQYILQGAALYVLIPVNANGQTSLKLVSSNGAATYPIDVTGLGTVETVVFQGPLDITWNDGGRVIIPASDFENVTAGAVMKIYFTQKDAWGQAQINNGSWTVIPFAELGNDGYLKTDTYNDKAVSEQELALTPEILNNILSNAGIIIQGSDWIITKVTLITGGGSSSEVVWEGSTPTESWSGFVQLTADKFANASAGKTIVVTCADVAAGAQWGIRDGSWSNIVDYADITGNTYEYAIDEAGLAALQASGGIFTGHDYTIIKIEIK